MSKKKRKKQVLVPKNGGEYSCIFCGVSGTPEEITIDPEIGRERKTFHCLPREYSGSTAGIQAVCLDCTFTHREELRKQFPEWFQTHRNLPVLAHMIDSEKRYEQALLEVQQHMVTNEITPDKGKVCKVCKRRHGDVFQSSGYPDFVFDCTDVKWVGGYHQTPEDVLANLLCDHCQHNERSKMRVFPLQSTLKMLQEREARRKSFEPKPLKEIVIIGGTKYHVG